MIENGKQKEVIIEVWIFMPSESVLLIVDARKPFVKGFMQFG